MPDLNSTTPAPDLSPVLVDPLHTLLADAGAEFISYGPGEGDGAPPVPIVQTFGPVEAEYAVIRKGVGVMAQPQVGVIRLTGGDRLDFLHRFLTHDTNALQPGQGRRAFLLTRQGRIVADMLVLQQADQTLLVLDAHLAATVAAELDKFLFTEDVAIADACGETYLIALHGPQAGTLLTAVASKPAGDGDGFTEPTEPLASTPITIAGAACLVYRQDVTGSPGLHVLAPREAAVAVMQKLAEPMAGLTPEAQGGKRRPITGRAIGWAAFNTARIEAGSPLFNVDFGPDTLPHETGVLDQAVSFTKGCYLGQEVVARMQSLGHPKRMLTGIKMQGDALPVAGAQVLDGAQGQEHDVIGAVTSSTLAPMLGGAPIALAMMKWGKHRPGAAVLVPAEGGKAAGETHALRLLPT